jgi:hypothetical protein
MIAGFVRHHLNKVPMGRLSMIVLLLTLLILMCEVIGGYHSGSISLYWLNYNGLVLVLSVAVFVLVCQLQIPEKGLWRVLVNAAPYTFGVYLIHDHLLVRGWLWTTLSLPSYCDTLAYPFMVVGLCLFIFVVCATIEAIRKKLFAVLGVDALIRKVDRWTF